jgi:hypothetical protein
MERKEAREATYLQWHDKEWDVCSLVAIEVKHTQYHTHTLTHTRTTMNRTCAPSSSLRPHTHTHACTLSLTHSLTHTYAHTDGPGDLELRLAQIECVLLLECVLTPIHRMGLEIWS